MNGRQRAAAAPAVIGHRGARGLWPENTMEGFDATIAIGVDGIEFDVGLTRDGVAVVHHDPALNRDTTRDPAGRWVPDTPDGPAPLHTLSFAELQAFDVGGLRPRSRYGLRFRGQREVPGARMPTLAASLQRMFAAGVTPTIEIKSVPPARFESSDAETPPPADLAAAAIEVLRSADAVDRILMTSFDWRVLSACRALEPDIDISCVTIESRGKDTIDAGRKAPSWTDGLAVADFGGSVPRMVRAFGSTSWSPYVGNVNEASVAEARSAGLRVFTWTVNHQREMRRMVQLGVDGIITDYPDRLRDVYRQEGLPLPPAGQPR